MTDSPVLFYTRQDIVSEALSWVGTEYHHQARRKGIACDCLGLIIGVYEHFHGDLPKDRVPPYTMWWAEELKQETLYQAADEYLDEIKLDEVLPGDVLLFRMKKNNPAKHCGICTRDGWMVHSYSGHGVVETPLLSGLTYAFRFPRVVD